MDIQSLTDKLKNDFEEAVSLEVERRLAEYKTKLQEAVSILAPLAGTAPIATAQEPQPIKENKPKRSAPKLNKCKWCGLEASRPYCSDKCMEAKQRVERDRIAREKALTSKSMPKLSPDTWDDDNYAPPPKDKTYTMHVAEAKDKEKRLMAKYGAKTFRSDEDA